MEEKLGGLQFFLDGIWGALKCEKMTLGVFKFLLSSMMFEYKGPGFHSVLQKVLYCVILKQFNQHFYKKI